MVRIKIQHLIEKALKNCKNYVELLRKTKMLHFCVDRKFMIHFYRLDKYITTFRILFVILAILTPLPKPNYQLHFSKKKTAHFLIYSKAMKPNRKIIAPYLFVLEILKLQTIFLKISCKKPRK